MFLLAYDIIMYIIHWNDDKSDEAVSAMQLEMRSVISSP